MEIGTKYGGIHLLALGCQRKQVLCDFKASLAYTSQDKQIITNIMNKETDQSERVWKLAICKCISKDFKSALKTSC